MLTRKHVKGKNMTEETNVININGKEYDAASFSSEQTYLVTQLKDLQATIEQAKFHLDRNQAAFDVFFKKLMETLDEKAEQAEAV